MSKIVLPTSSDTGGEKGWEYIDIEKEKFKNYREKFTYYWKIFGKLSEKIKEINSLYEKLVKDYFHYCEVAIINVDHLKIDQIINKILFNISKI